METYLNLAHRSHRKAEFYTKNQQFSQAIHHHKVASEYLDKAIVQTQCDTLRISLIVQRDYDIAQIELLNRRIAYQQNLANKNNDTGRTADSPSDQTVHSHTITKMALEQLEQKYQELYQVMNEQDTLIKCLVEAEKNLPTVQLDDENSTMEQLQNNNEKMRQWIATLVEKLEKSNDDCKLLRDENEKLKKDISNLRLRPESKPELPELPPLEPPTLLY